MKLRLASVALSLGLLVPGVGRAAPPTSGSASPSVQAPDSAAGAGAPTTPAPTAGPQPVVTRPFLVVLDPGHGGSNEGCLAHDGHVREKDVTLQLAKDVRAALSDRLPHARVVLTREADATLLLSERVAMANAAQADLFISVHANASPAASQVGFETYVLDARASGLEAARTARRENARARAGTNDSQHDVGSTGGDPDEDDPDAARDEMSRRQAGTMIAELAQVASRSQAALLAHAIQRAQAQTFPARADRGVKQAPFDVLIGARMPAVLFEAGFLDHAGEGPLLIEPDGRGRIAEALADAVLDFYRTQSQLR